MKILAKKDWVKDPEEYVRETFYRLTEEDVVSVCEDYFDLTEEEIFKIVEEIEDRFELYDWTQDLRFYIQTCIDEMETP